MEYARPKSRLLIVAGIALAVVVVAVGGLGLSRKIESFQPLGFAAREAQGNWLVQRVDQPGTSLEAQDRIVLVNGAEVAGLAEPATTLRAAPESELVVLRGEKLETVTFRLPPLQIDYPYLVLALVGIGYLLIGLFTLLKDRRRPARIFYLWCLTSALLYLASPTSLADLAGRLVFFGDQLARIVLPPLTLHLFLVFPRPLSEAPWLRRLVPFLYLPAAFLLLLQADLMVSGGSWFFAGAVASGIELMDRVEIVVLAVYALLAIASLLRRWLYTEDLEQRRQVAWVTVGLAGGYLPFLAIYVAPLAAGFRWPLFVDTLAVLPLAVVPITFAYAILRYKLWDIGVVVRDTLALTFTVLIGVFGFTLANTVVSRVVPSDLSLARNVLTFVTGLVIAGVLIPTRHQIGSSLQRLQYGTSFGKRRALLDFGRELMDERDLTTLCDTLRRQLEEGLDLIQADVYLVSGNGLIPASGVSGTVPLAITSFGYDFWHHDVESLSGLALPESELTWQQRLYARGYRYAFPLMVRDRPVGFVVTGYKLDDTPLSSDDIDLVRGLLNQAALGIENARLLDKVQRQLDEVVRLQEFSQSIIDSSPAGIAVIDGSGKVVSCNGALSELLGETAAAIRHRPLRELLMLEELPAPGEGLVEGSYVDPSGNERVVQVSVAGLAEERSDRHHVVVIQDVTQRRQMENALKENERLASLGMLAAGVAHEVNTPITGISSYAQMLLADTPKDDPRHNLLRKVERQTFRAARIVNNLLDFARERSSERVPVDLPRLIDECLDLLKERLAEEDIRLDWNSPREPSVVYGNEGELMQVFTNLIVNATDAMAAGGGDLSITVETEDGWVLASVEDTGPGIPSEQLAQVFQPFYSTKLSKGGTGLGLSISYNIVRQHGGEIRVVNQPDSGCRFVVELPRHHAEKIAAKIEVPSDLSA